MTPRYRPLLVRDRAADCVSFRLSSGRERSGSELISTAAQPELFENRAGEKAGKAAFKMRDCSLKSEGFAFCKFFQIGDLFKFQIPIRLEKIE